MGPRNSSSLITEGRSFDNLRCSSCKSPLKKPVGGIPAWFHPARLPGPATDDSRLVIARPSRKCPRVHFCAEKSSNVVFAPPLAPAASRMLQLTQHLAEGINLAFVAELLPFADRPGVRSKIPENEVRFKNRHFKARSRRLSWLRGLPPVPSLQGDLLVHHGIDQPAGVERGGVPERRHQRVGIGKDDMLDGACADRTQR